MTRIHIAHHEPDAAAPLLAEVYYVDPAGVAEPAPVQRLEIAPGVAGIIHLRPGCVLTVRQTPDAPRAARAANREP